MGGGGRVGGVTEMAGIWRGRRNGGFCAIKAILASFSSSFMGSIANHTETIQRLFYIIKTNTPTKAREGNAKKKGC